MIAGTSRPYSRTVVLGLAAVSLLLAGTVALWARYGAAVIYEMIVQGLAACL
jgi:hypothetical protein